MIEAAPAALSAAPAAQSVAGAYTIYADVGFDDSANWGLSYNRPNDNHIVWEESEGDGYLRLDKCSATDLYIDVNELQTPASRVVFEQDIFLEPDHPDAVLFYLRDSVTTGTNVVATLLEVTGGKLKIGEQTADISTGEWHRVSAAVDFSASSYDIYLDGRLIFPDMAMDGRMKAPSLWRTYIGAASPDGDLLTDNLRVYDGYRPRLLDGPDAVYADLRFENTQEWGLNYTRTNGNTLVWAEDAATGSGYLHLEKVNASDAYFDVDNLAFACGFVVFEMDVLPGDENPSGQLFYLRDKVTTGSDLNAGLVEIVQGALKYGEQTFPVAAGQWHTVSAAVDFLNSRYDVYLDGALILENIALDTNLQKPSLWRVYLYSGDTPGTLGFDNLRVYDGTEPRSIGQEAPPEKDIFTDDAALAALSERRALQSYGETLFADGRKTSVAGRVLLDGDEALVPADVFEKLFAVSVTVSGGEAELADRTKFAAGEDTAEIAGKTVRLEAAPRLEDGVLYLPVCAYGENALGDGCFYDDGHGMFLVSDTPIDTSDARLKEANLYLFFERADAGELKELLTARHGDDLTAAHPRVLADADDFAALRAEVESDAVKAAWFAQLRTRADSYLEQPVLEYTITNGRLLDVANSALQRVSDLGMAWQITGESAYGERLVAELEAISSFRDWHPEHTLDTGTMAMAAALAYDWGYSAMSEAQRTEIAQRLFTLGLETAHAAYYGTASYPSWWTNTETNWGVVVNGGLFNLAVAIAETDPDYAMDIAEKAKRSMEYTVYRIAPDGAWYEGPGYWSYLFQFLSYTMAGSESAFGRPDELLKFKGMRGYAEYQAYVSDPAGDVNNFHDSDTGPIGSYGTFYVARALGLSQLMADRAAFMQEHSQMATAFDLLWYDPSGAAPSGGEMALDAYYRETEFVSMRQNWDDENALWASFHGGSLNAAHDHIDAGTFVFNLGGVRWAVDLPKEMLSYVSDAENPSIQAGYNSYYFYRRKAEGHNVVVINPDAQLEMDQSQTAKVVAMESGAGRSYAVIDLSDVYRQDADSYLRGYLVADGRRSFTVRDEIKLKGSSELYWFMHTEGDVVLVDGNTAVILQDGRQLKVQFATDAPEYELSVMEAKKLPSSPQFTETDNPDVTKLAFRLNASGEVTITVKMSLVGEEASKTGPETAPISAWSVSGGSAVSAESGGSLARLSELTVNGYALLDFDPETFRYVYGLDEDETSVEIAAKGSGRVEVLAHNLAVGNEIREVRVYDDAGKYTSYVVEIEPYSPQSLTRFVRHEVVGAEASSEQIEIGVAENYCEGSFDGDMTTRWSANGIGEWCVHDLGETKRIDAFGVALWMGAQRRFYFDLEISNDGVNFTPVVKDYVSCGTTEDIEVILLSEPVEARYVRYVGYGNSVNEWNNVIELASYIDKKALSAAPDGEPDTPGAAPDAGDGGTGASGGAGTATGGQETSPGSPAGTPETGDAFAPALCGAVMALAAAGVCVMLAGRGGKRKN